MAYFDFLIDKKNLAPKPEMEYIYFMDMVWKPNELESHPITKGTIVKDVIQLENKSYEFTIPGREGRWRTNYAWSLLENTPENNERLKIYQEEKQKLDEFESKVNGLWNALASLKGSAPKNDIALEK